MTFWIGWSLFYAFAFISRLSWILSTQMVWQCQLCCLVGVCWWWQENLDTFGPMGMYWNDLDDRIPFALWESHSFLSHQNHASGLHIEVCTCPGPRRDIYGFLKKLYFEKVSNLKKNCKHSMVNSLHLSHRFTSCEYFAVWFHCCHNFFSMSTDAAQTHEERVWKK